MCHHPQKNLNHPEREKKKEKKMAPDAFVCPITRAVMERPVVCADGHSYEEDAIRRWLARSARSPMTNAPLQSTALVPNIALRHAIAEWRTGSEE